MVSGSMFGDAYRGKTVLLTGHTGFKGSWMAEWLLMLGANVVGFSHKVDDGPSHFDSLGLADRMTHILGDVRDADALYDVVTAHKPDYVFHLAAQSLVRYSYDHPVETMATNVMGTVNLLDALRRAGHPAAVVCVTSDKCYENREVLSGYREDDPMGGHDTYSASKGAAEIAAHSYRRSFFSGPDSPVKMATVRAGNVIGGGDWSLDRIVPDCVRSLAKGEAIRIRNPHATRPWQHVLESLSGYLWLGALLGGAATTARVKSPSDVTEAFNFGPWVEANGSVERLVTEFLKHWPGEWVNAAEAGAVHEAGLLGLSIDKAYHKLGWAPTLDFAGGVALTAGWYRAVVADKRPALEQTRHDIESFVAEARAKSLAWAA